MKKILCFCFAVSLLVVSGCAEITPPTMESILESPLGTGPLRVGMTKEEVKEVWGLPDSIESLSSDEWGREKVLWTYEGKYPGLVLFDVGHASKTKYLTFDGDNLVSFHD